MKPAKKNGILLVLAMTIVAAGAASQAQGSKAATNADGGEAQSASSPDGTSVHLFPVSVNHRWGFIDAAGALVIPAKFDHVDEYADADYSEGLIPVAGASGKWGYCDLKGKMVIEQKYFSAYPFKFGVARVQLFATDDVFKGGKVIYIDKTGKNILSDDYEIITDVPGHPDFEEGMLQVRKNGKYGFIDTAGKLVIPCDYHEAGNFSEGVAVAKLAPDGQYGYIDKKGDWAIQPQFDYANNFHDAVAVVQWPGSNKEGFIDKTGKVLGTAESLVRYFVSYPFMKTVAYGRHAFEKKGKVGFVDTTGKVVVKPKYDDAYGYSDGLAAVCKGGKKNPKISMRPYSGTLYRGAWGFINLKGKTVIPNHFGEVTSFKEGVAAAMKKDLWGIIDKKGQWIFEPKFKERPGEPNHGLISLRCVDGYCDQIAYIDKTGKVIWSILYDE